MYHVYNGCTTVALPIFSIFVFICDLPSLLNYPLILNFGMEDFWNEFDLKKPPLLTIQIEGAQFTGSLQSIFTKFLQQQHNAEHKEFAQNAALLSRLMARRKNSFRRLMVFKCICKLNAALCRLLRVDLPRIVESFASTLPDMVYETKADVPSRNNFDFVLVRLLSVYNIHQRIIKCCKEAATFITEMLRTNFFLEINTLLLAVIAKLCSKSHIFSNNYIKLYGQLLPYRMRFPQNEKYTFLPNNFEFPRELNEIDTEKEHKPRAEDMKIDDLQMPTVSKKFRAPVITKLKKKCDLGTIINRASNVQPVLNIEEMQTVDAIRKFIAAENKARAMSSQTCRTKAILSHEWQGAVRLFEKKLQTNEKQKAMSIFKKFLSSKI